MNQSQNPPSSSENVVPPVAASIAPGSTNNPPQIVVQSSIGLVRRTLTWIGWAGFLLCLVALVSQWSARRDYYDVTDGIREKYHSGAENATDKVAIIAVRGLILQGDGFVKRQIDRVRQDEQVKAVVLRVNSPGGTVTGSDYIYHHLQRLRDEREIPIVVSMGSIAASGGYYVSMAVGDQEKSIFAEPTTTTGSIGVIMPHYDISGLLKEFQVEDDSIASHPRKQLLSMTRPMSEADREIVQAYIDESFRRFKGIVKAGRPGLRGEAGSDRLVDPHSDQDLATGEIFTAGQAKEHGLIDEVGFIEDALDRAVELAGLEKGQVRFVHYRQPASLMSLVGMAQASQSNQIESLSLSMLFELNTPRAYFLSTTLPILVRGRDEL